MSVEGKVKGENEKESLSKVFPNLPEYDDNKQIFQWHPSFGCPFSTDAYLHIDTVVVPVIMIYA